MDWILGAFSAYVAIGFFYSGGTNSNADMLWPVKVYRKWKESRGR